MEYNTSPITKSIDTNNFTIEPESRNASEATKSSAATPNYTLPESSEPESHSSSKKDDFTSSQSTQRDYSTMATIPWAYLPQYSQGIHLAIY